MDNYLTPTQFRKHLSDIKELLGLDIRLASNDHVNGFFSIKVYDVGPTCTVAAPDNPVASALKRGVIRQRIEVEDVAEFDEDTATFASELAGELLAAEGVVEEVEDQNSVGDDEEGSSSSNTTTGSASSPLI